MNDPTPTAKKGFSNAVTGEGRALANTSAPLGAVGGTPEDYREMSDRDLEREADEMLQLERSLVLFTHSLRKRLNRLNRDASKGYTAEAADALLISLDEDVALYVTRPLYSMRFELSGRD